jgi:hypothetical protein
MRCLGGVAQIDRVHLNQAVSRTLYVRDKHKGERRGERDQTKTLPRQSDLCGLGFGGGLYSAVARFSVDWWRRWGLLVASASSTLPVAGPFHAPPDPEARAQMMRNGARPARNGSQAPSRGLWSSARRVVAGATAPSG